MDELEVLVHFPKQLPSEISRVTFQVEKCKQLILLQT